VGESFNNYFPIFTQDIIRTGNDALDAFNFSLASDTESALIEVLFTVPFRAVVYLS
jgi:hypothetical protein